MNLDIAHVKPPLLGQLVSLASLDLEIKPKNYMGSDGSKHICLHFQAHFLFRFLVYGTVKIFRIAIHGN